MVNLLESFALVHTQVTRVHAELNEIINRDHKLNAKVEFKMTPREIATAQSPVQYQVSALMKCIGRYEESASEQSLFQVEVVLQAVYQQFDGVAVDFETFRVNNGSLTRQLYPLVHHLLRPIFQQLGLDHVQLPFDLPGQDAESANARLVH